MGLRERITESLYKLRIIPNQTAADKTTFSKEGQTLPDQLNSAIDAGKRIDFNDLLKIDNLKVNRNRKYEIFEDMVADGRIGAAVEMYANDTVQYNQEGKILWVEADNPDVSAYVEKLLQDLNIQQNCWTHAYRLYLYGDVYLETFKSSSTDGSKPTVLLAKPNNGQIGIQQPLIGQNIERYIEIVPNPANIYDLQSKGKTSGYAKGEDDLSDMSNDSLNYYCYTNETHNIDLFSPTKYIHICLSPNINRFPEKFRLVDIDKKPQSRDDNLIDGSSLEGSSSGEFTYNVKTGQSILENVYGPYQTLKLKEDSVLLERVTKSSITRIIQIELGDMPEPQKKVKLQEIKQQIEQQLLMNKDTGSIMSRPNPQASENIIYTTTNNGKGQISSVNIGGDADIGNTDDIDKSENKLYGSLLIPKALLGADMEGSGLSNGGSLTEMNTTYARRIKRGQQALIAGYTDLVNIFALAEGMGETVVNNFKLRLTPIITVEDTRRDELLDQKIRNSSSLMELIDNIDGLETETKLEIILNWLSSYLGQQDAADIIRTQFEEDEASEELDKDNKDKVKDKEDHHIDVNINNKPSSLDTDFEVPTLNKKIDVDTTEEIKEPNLEIPVQADLNDIAGEDLL